MKTPHVEFKRFPNPETLAAGAARDWVSLLQGASRPYTVALSGGRIAKTFYAAITELADTPEAPLAGVHFYFADERCVDPSDKESNFLLAQDGLFRPLGISPNKVHRLKGEWLPMAALSEATHDLRRIVPSDKEGVPVLDMIFLGIGEDGHTASLMPNAAPDVLQSREPYAHVANSPKPPPDRLTMTYPMLGAAKKVWALVSGAGKAEALRNSLKPNGTTPFARVLRSRPDTVIYTDLNEIADEWSK